jgi:hypothetical protein
MLIVLNRVTANGWHRDRALGLLAVREYNASSGKSGFADRFLYIG